jgi:hypothetical protein
MGNDFPSKTIEWPQKGTKGAKITSCIFCAFCAFLRPSCEISGLALNSQGHFEKLLFPDKRTNREWTRMNANVSIPALVQQSYLLFEFASIRVHSRLKRLFQGALNS